MIVIAVSALGQVVIYIGIAIAILVVACLLVLVAMEIMNVWNEHAR